MRGLFSFIRFLLVLAVFAVAGAWLLGSALPREHETSRSAVIDVPPHTLFPVLITPEAYPEWRTGITRVDRPDSDRFTEHGPDGPVTYRFLDRTPSSRLVVAVDDPDQVFSGTWTYELEPADRSGRATRLRITERGEVSNPVFRAIGRVMMDPAESIETFLKDLGKRYGRDVKIETEKVR